ncbi:hypothetical protein [Streptomyces sp. NPDC057889]|uniref:hypothetical protein n=1 Tax=unclassified Streptomyces TaxID=2593676 RepID=UPI0036A2D5C0
MKTSDRESSDDLSKARRPQHVTAAAWLFLGLVLLCVTALLGLQTAVSFGALGESGHITASRCVEKDGGKGGSYILCEGPFTSNKGTVDPLAKVRYPGHEGETISTYRAPWGTYEATVGGFWSKLPQVLFPLLLLGAAIGCLLRATTYL